MNDTARTTFLPLVLLAVLAGCGESETTKAASSSSAPKSKPAATAAPSEPSAKLDREAVGATLKAYDVLRQNLAKEELAELAGAASALAGQAEKAAAAASGEAKTHLEGMAKNAKAVEAAAKDVDGARKAFGEVSRHAVALVASDEKLQEGRHVFECPMAKGYRKWLQEDAELSNPYMGKAMPGCGAKSSWQ